MLQSSSMEFLIFLMLLLFCLCEITNASPDGSDKYKKTLTNKKLPSLLATFSDISLMLCSYECSKNDNCMGFAYNPTSRICKQSEHSPFLVQDVVQDETGFNLYNNEDLLCRLDFTGHMASSTVDGFTSPSFPSSYENDVDLYWLIVKPSKTSTLRITFIRFDIQFSVGCTKDILFFYRGYCTSDPYLMGMCGSAPAPELPVLTESTSLYVLVHLYTDSSNDDDHDGFHLQYEMI